MSNNPHAPRRGAKKSRRTTHLLLTEKHKHSARTPYHQPDSFRTEAAAHTHTATNQRNLPATPASLIRPAARATNSSAPSLETHAFSDQFIVQYFYFFPLAPAPTPTSYFSLNAPPLSLTLSHFLQLSLCESLCESLCLSLSESLCLSLHLQLNPLHAHRLAASRKIVCLSAWPSNTGFVPLSSLARRPLADTSSLKSENQHTQK